jgi:hypothetical protein
MPPLRGAPLATQSSTISAVYRVTVGQGLKKKGDTERVAHSTTAANVKPQTLLTREWVAWPYRSEETPRQRQSGPTLPVSLGARQ